MACWLLKTEPSTYSFVDLTRDRRTTWDGVSNAQALIHLRAMKAGDEVLVYHTGGDKAIVGLAKIAAGPRADPRLDDPRMVVVDVEAVRALTAPLSLADIKRDGALAGLDLVRNSRLSCMPVSPAHRARLRILGVK